MSMLALVRLGVFENFPSEGISVQDLALRVSLNENFLRRLLSHAATYHIFFQSRPDFFIHTAGSRVIAENEGMRTWLFIGLGETMPGCFRVGSSSWSFLRIS